VREDGDLWVFGYGSLMWRPGFAFVERHVGTLHGWRRRLCVYSHFHRGTPDRPGLVLGLDRGGACRGVVFRVEAARREPTVDYLRERELVTHVYREIEAGVRLDDGRRVTALTYVCDPRHPQFAGRLEHDALLRFIRQGHGVSGANRDYVRNTAAHLVELGIRDAVLARLAADLE
jgi:cation transport protein ChaC